MARDAYHDDGTLAREVLRHIRSRYGAQMCLQCLAAAVHKAGYLLEREAAACARDGDYSGDNSERRRLV